MENKSSGKKFSKKLWSTIQSIIILLIILFVIFAVCLLIADALSNEYLYKNTTFSKIMAREWYLIKNFDYPGVWIKIKGFFR